MSEYIKLKSALKILDSVMSDEGIKHKGKAIRKRLNELPTEDVEKVKHGEWIKKPHIRKEYKQCPVCKYDFSRLEPDNYCPNCGARMDKKEGAEQ